MIDGVLTGRLIYKPRILWNRYGKRYVIAKMNVLAENTSLPDVPIRVDVIAFDKLVCACLLDLEIGAVVSLAGVIKPCMEKDEWSGMDNIALEMTACRVLDNYLVGANKGKGAWFHYV